MSEGDFNSPRRWAGRIAFPLAAVAVVLAMNGLKSEGQAWPWFVAATVAAGAGAVCLRLSRPKL